MCDFKIGDSVNVLVDWAPELKTKKATIEAIKDSPYGNEKFAKVYWARGGGDYEARYGQWFSCKYELKKI